MKLDPRNKYLLNMLKIYMYYILFKSATILRNKNYKLSILLNDPTNLFILKSSNMETTEPKNLPPKPMYPKYNWNKPKTKKIQ